MNEIEVVGGTIGGAFVAIDPTEHDRQVYEDIKTQFGEEINKKHPQIQRLFNVESSLLKLYPTASSQADHGAAPPAIRW